jgi:hypothetical protein
VSERQAGERVTKIERRVGERVSETESLNGERERESDEGWQQVVGWRRRRLNSEDVQSAVRIRSA